MAIHALQHAKDLHAPNHVLYPLAGMCQLPVLLTLLGGKRRRGRRLMGRDGVPMTSPQALISGIPDQGRIVGKPHARLTVELQIMVRSSTRGGAQNPLRHGTDEQLELQGMSLLLAAVPTALLFLGRSHGTSEASTATML